MSVKAIRRAEQEINKTEQALQALRQVSESLGLAVDSRSLGGIERAVQKLQQSRDTAREIRGRLRKYSIGRKLLEGRMTAAPLGDRPDILKVAMFLQMTKGAGTWDDLSRLNPLSRRPQGLKPPQPTTIGPAPGATVGKKKPTAPPAPVVPPRAASPASVPRAPASPAPAATAPAAPRAPASPAPAATAPAAPKAPASPAPAAAVPAPSTQGWSREELESGVPAVLGTDDPDRDFEARRNFHRAVREHDFWRMRGVEPDASLAAGDWEAYEKWKTDWMAAHDNPKYGGTSPPLPGEGRWYQNDADYEQAALQMYTQNGTVLPEAAKGWTTSQLQNYLQTHSAERDERGYPLTAEALDAPKWTGQNRAEMDRFVAEVNAAGFGDQMRLAERQFGKPLRQWTLKEFSQFKRKVDDPRLSGRGLSQINGDLSVAAIQENNKDWLDTVGDAAGAVGRGLWGGAKAVGGAVRGAVNAVGDAVGGGVEGVKSKMEQRVMADLDATLRNPEFSTNPEYRTAAIAKVRKYSEDFADILDDPKFANFSHETVVTVLDGLKELDPEARKAILGDPKTAENWLTGLVAKAAPDEIIKLAAGEDAELVQGFMALKGLDPKSEEYKQQAAALFAKVKQSDAGKAMMASQGGLAGAVMNGDWSAVGDQLKSFFSIEGLKGAWEQAQNGQFGGLFKYLVAGGGILALANALFGGGGMVEKLTSGIVGIGAIAGAVAGPDLISQFLQPAAAGAGDEQTRTSAEEAADAAKVPTAKNIGGTLGEVVKNWTSRILPTPAKELN